MEPMDAGELRTVLGAELGKLRAVEDQTRLADHLVEPSELRCAWDYGEPGQTYPCWLVAEVRARDVGIVFCEHGFGPKCPWGLIRLPKPDDPAPPHMGDDSSWFDTLAEAFDNAV
jgi:hypothetical protein